MYWNTYIFSTTEQIHVAFFCPHLKRCLLSVVSVPVSPPHLLTCPAFTDSLITITTRLALISSLLLLLQGKEVVVVVVVVKQSNRPKKKIHFLIFVKRKELQVFFLYKSKIWFLGSQKQHVFNTITGAVNSFRVYNCSRQRYMANNNKGNTLYIGSAGCFHKPTVLLPVIHKWMMNDVYWHLASAATCCLSNNSPCRNSFIIKCKVATMSENVLKCAFQFHMTIHKIQELKYSIPAHAATFPCLFNQI